MLHLLEWDTLCTNQELRVNFISHIKGSCRGSYGEAHYSQFVNAIITAALLLGRG